MKTGIYEALRASMIVMTIALVPMLYLTVATTPAPELPLEATTTEAYVKPAFNAPEIKTLENVQVVTEEKLPTEADPVALTPPTPDTLETNEPTYTDWELEMLALVIYQEAGGDKCSDETRLMVGTVVMNRIADDRFPDTMEEVITQERQYGRLHWTGIVWPANAADPTEEHAVERAYTIAKRILDGERVLEQDVIFQAEFLQGKEMVAYSDGMYFCR